MKLSRKRLIALKRVLSIDTPDLLRDINFGVSYYVKTYRTPCNVQFLQTDFNSLSPFFKFEDLVEYGKLLAKQRDTVSFGISVTEREVGWGIVKEWCQANPDKCQVIITRSRHNNYKVAWVIIGVRKTVLKGW